MAARSETRVDIAPRDNAKFSSREILERVARRTHRFDFAVWFWGDAIAFDGLLDAAELLPNEAHTRFCSSFYERWQRAAAAWTDYLAPGLSLIRLVRRHGKVAFEPLARRLLDHYRETTPRGTTGLHYFRPDLPQFRTTLLINSLYHVPPFVAACGDLLGDKSLHQEGLAMWVDHADRPECARQSTVVSQLRARHRAASRLWVGTRQRLGAVRSARPNRDRSRKVCGEEGGHRQVP